MSHDLTTSNLRRQSVLNNPYALDNIEKSLDIKGLKFDGLPVFTIFQITQILEVDKRTIERIINENNEELSHSGYRIIKSSELRDFKALAHVADINVGDIDPKVPQLGIFSFKAFLNITMLITGSEKARTLRSQILDVVTKVIMEKAGDRAFVNQRDEYYLTSAFQEEIYRKEFTAAVNKYVEGNQWKYKHCADSIYKSIFEERAAEYRKILNIQSRENVDVRDTFYSELLNLVASFEAGLPDYLKVESEKLGRKLKVKEAMNIIEEFGRQPLFKPHIHDVRTKIATRDYSLRDAIHEKLEAYIQVAQIEDYERFLGKKSKALQERIKESIDVYKRLKDR